MAPAPPIHENQRVRMHDLIAAGVAAARQRKRWTQEEAARRFRHVGLTTYRTSTVGSLEAGLRRPRLDEVLLMCAALDCTLDQLLPATEEPIELGDGAVMSADAVRSLLCDGMPAETTAEMHFPGDATEVEYVLGRAVAEVDQIMPLLVPIRRHSPSLGDEDITAALELPDDAERHAARRLGIHPSQVKLASRALWRRDFAEERDARIGDLSQLEPRSRQARRGLVTREMLGAMRDYLDSVPGERGADA
jgi:transcriptional regulator with XRE-family HTH domain